MTAAPSTAALSTTASTKVWAPPTHTMNRALSLVVIGLGALPAVFGAFQLDPSGLLLGVPVAVVGILMRKGKLWKTDPAFFVQHGCLTLAMSSSDDPIRSWPLHMVTGFRVDLIEVDDMGTKKKQPILRILFTDGTGWDPGFRLARVHLDNAIAALQQELALSPGDERHQ